MMCDSTSVRIVVKEFHEKQFLFFKNNFIPLSVIVTQSYFYPYQVVAYSRVEKVFFSQYYCLLKQIQIVETQAPRQS